MPAEGQAPGPGEPGTMEPGLAAQTTPAAQAAPVTAPRRSLLHRCLVAFGHFWWDFLVGDTPELLIGVRHRPGRGCPPDKRSRG